MYPSTGDTSDHTTSSKWVPLLLHQLLSGLVRDDVKSFAISNAVPQALRPRSVISPVVLDVSVEMDQVFESCWLVDELSQLGFSVSYDEVPGISSLCYRMASLAMCVIIQHALPSG